MKGHERKVFLYQNGMNYFLIMEKLIKQNHRIEFYIPQVNKKNSQKRQEKGMKRNQNLDKESHISIL
jgi:hypothetical protein